jgi:hypothetical protein
MRRDKRAGSLHGGWRIIAGTSGVFIYVENAWLTDNCKLFEEMLNSGRLVCMTTRFSISGRVSCGIITSH